MPNSFRGQFLIAAKHLKDPNFFKTVVFLLEHNQHGAMGLVINRPSSVTVAQVLSKHFDLPETGEVVFIGGPVEPGNLFILHNAEELDGSETPPLDGVFVGCSEDVFRSVVQAVSEGDDTARFRVFSGCAGWAPNQLEGEINRGDWFIHDAAPEQVFEKDPYGLWDNLIRDFQEAHRLLPQTTEHPEWN